MKALGKNIFREIRKTKSRFISIFAIIALSTGFFTGVRAASPSMKLTGHEYFRANNLMDLRIVSTVGFDDDDIRSIHDDENVRGVMPGYLTDLLMNHDGIDSVVRVYSVPEKTETNDEIINKPDLIAGRLPKKPGECVLDGNIYKAGGYKLGDKLVFNDTINGKATTDTIKDLEYEIVGAVNTPIYITYQRGNTNVGDGSISFYIMVLPEEFCSERYTNVYVTTNSHDGIEPYSDEYMDIIDRQSEDLKELSVGRIKAFNETTLSDAQEKLDDARKEYNEKKDEAEKKLLDGEKKLHDGEKELAEKLIEGMEKLDDAQQQLTDGKSKLTQGQEDYTKGIEDAKKKLTDAQDQYAEGKEQYLLAKQEYDREIEKAQKQLDDAETEYRTQYSIFYGTTKPQAETKLTLLKEAIDLCSSGLELAEEKVSEIEDRINEAVEPLTDEQFELERLNTKITEYKTKLDEYQKQYDDGKKLLDDGEAQLISAGDQLSDAKAQLQEKKLEGMAKLGEAEIQLENAQSQLENGRLEYETAMMNGILQLQGAQSELESGEKELEKGRQELEEQRKAGMQRLKEAREQLAAGKAEASFQLNDAEKKLNDAQDSLSMLDDAKWYIYTRDDNPGYSNLDEDAQRVDNIALVFPFFFLLVAALVCLTTMSRMVEERRTEIGTLKALGYSNKAIASKYFIYAASASITGSLFGAVIGTATLPFIILDAYAIMYALPKTILVIPWDSFAFSAGTGILCTCLVAIGACLKELRSRPAALMRTKAPKPGKRILLEHFTLLWKHMNFTSKVTARNIFRYKARFLMTVIGVAGCTALIIGGMGLKDSITVIADRQYDNITIFDEVFALSESGTAKEKRYLMSQLHNDDRLKEVLLVSQNWSTVSYDKGHSKIDVRIVAGENYEDFKKIFILRNRQTQEHIPLDDSGIVINERLAQITGIKTGDPLSFTIDEEEYKAVVSGITENYTGNYIYLTPSMYNTLTGRNIKYNLVYAQVEDEARQNEKEIANDWIKHDEIVTVTLLNEQLEAILNALESLNFIVLVLIFCAGMLAIVVLYNLTNINISERVREIATIKVLGFYDLETANYIYRENTILTIVGALAGLPLGTVFAAFVVEGIQMDMVMFPHQINTTSYLTGFILTIVFSVLVNFVMYFKMKNVSMVESLKSVE